MTSSSPTVSRSYSYPLESPWHAADAVDTRKGSLDSNNPATNQDQLPSSPDTLNINININITQSSLANTSDTKVQPRLKHGKSPTEDVRTSRTRMWRNSGSVLQSRLVAYTSEEPQLDLSHLNIETIPKVLYKTEQYLTLIDLNLSYNKLSTLPPQLNQLRLLKILDCTFNKLSDLPVELGELHSLESLKLSGNPLHKDLTQKHLLGTPAVLQYLRDRQVLEGTRVRKSNKFKPPTGTLKASSDPESRSREENTLLPRPPSITPSPVPSPNPTQRNILSSSGSNLDMSIHIKDNKDKNVPLQRQRSIPPHTPPQPILVSQTPPTNPPSTTPPQDQQSPPEPPRGDMGPIITQLKLGIIYAETVKSTMAAAAASAAAAFTAATGTTTSSSNSFLSPETASVHKQHRSSSYGGAEDIPNGNHSTIVVSPTHGSKEKFSLNFGDGKFTFNSYCTSAFNELRNLALVPQDRYLAALESISALGFAGKSGAVLLKSADGLLVIKTISKDEAKFLRKIMPQILSSNPKTYLTRFWGLYKVIRSPLEKASFIVMKNAFFTSMKIHERYDLKGSTVGRTTDEGNVRRSRIVLKDLNFTRQLRLGEERAKAFVAQLEKDTEFLQKFDIIDYSLIVGVHYLAEAPTKDPTKQYPIEGEIQAIDKEGNPLDEVYFLNIIDMLQPYNIRKQMEYNIKSIRYGTGISVIPPEKYLYLL